MPQADVIILGAGVAGLAAAVDLSRAGLSVQLLEARGRIGGRIHTLHDPAFPAAVELGAEFVHGLPQETWNIIRSANLTAYEGIDEHWILEKPRTTSRTKRARLRKRLVRADDFWERLESVLSRLGKTGPRDTTFDGFAARCCKSARLRRNLSLTRAYVEGFNAADAKRISAKSLVESQEASEKIQGTRLFRLLNGYDSLVEALHAGLDSRLIRVSLNRTVKVLRWRRDDSAAVSAGRSDANDAKIKVTAVDPSGHSQAFTSDRAIVTLPLGILQARPGDTAAVDFQPTLSPRKTSAIARLAMGTVVKVILRFREAFWETMPLPALDPPAPLFDLSFLHGTDLSFSTWWTLRPLHTPMLIGWAGGPIAVELSRLSQEEILIEAINSLNALLGLPTETLRRQLSAHYIADWLSDPFSRGAYTYIPRGATDAVESLAAPEGGTLFFAGEATHHEGLSGTVAGAIGSGQRAAREVIAES